MRACVAWRGLPRIDAGAQVLIEAGAPAWVRQLQAKGCWVLGLTSRYSTMAVRHES
jgi:hypothetical protein